MRTLTRRQWAGRLLALGSLPLLGTAARTFAAGEPQIVKIVARRFQYTPGEFRVKAGTDVVLEFTSVDFVHGFNMPEMHLRADLPPGVTTRVRFTAGQPGTYDFLCDNFCGDGHEEMHGRMIVEA